MSARIHLLSRISNPGSRSRIQVLCERHSGKLSERHPGNFRENIPGSLWEYSAQELSIDGNSIFRTLEERPIYERYKKVTWVLICFVMVRKMGLFAYKSLFAKHLLEPDTDLLRAPIIFCMLVYSSRSVPKLNRALDMYEKFPHDGEYHRILIMC